MGCLLLHRHRQRLCLTVRCLIYGRWIQSNELPLLVMASGKCPVFCRLIVKDSSFFLSVLLLLFSVSI